MTKAITLHQPWATLIALGVKTIETRSWKPPKALVGERLLIHAAKRNPFVEGPDRVGDFVVGTDGSPYIRKVRGGLTIKEGMGYPVPLPLGAIVASCVLADAVPMVDREAANDEDGDLALPCREVWISDEPLALAQWNHGWDYVEIEDQRPYGDFAPGRWAWLLEDVKPTTERCPACWGEICDKPLGTGYGDVPCVLQPGHDGRCDSFAFDDRLEPWCSVCQGLNACPPVPAEGHQRVWEWTP